MSDFEWQTDEDEEVWAAEEETAVTPSRPTFLRWWPLLLIGLLGGGAVWMLSQQVNERVDSAEDSTKSDVLAAHNLVMRAAAEQDEALFRLNLSGIDPDWVEAQTELVVEGAFFDRQTYHFELEGDKTAVSSPSIADITLSDDFTEATVPYTMPYVVEVGEGMTETVMLRHTAVYRKGQTRWLYAPPNSDYWGDSKSLAYSHLQVIVREQDERWVSRYAAQINSYLQQLCRSDNFDCPADWRMKVAFVIEPVGVEAERQEIIQTRSEFVPLPTISLLGAPATPEAEAAQEALYAELIITKAMSELSGYNCCRVQNFFELVVDKQLDELGIRPFSLTTEQYDTIFSNWNPVILNRLWFSQPLDLEDKQYGLVLLTFLQEELPEMTNLALIQTAMNPEVERYRDWIATLSDDEMFQSQAALAAELEQFLFENSTSGTAVAQNPLPQANLRLVCYNNSRTGLALFEYNMQTLQFIEEFSYETESDSEFVWLDISNPYGFALFYENYFSGTQRLGTISLFKDGELTPLYEGGDEDPHFIYGVIRPEVDVVSVVREEDQIHFDLEACDDSGCAQVDFATSQFAIWSPDGSRYLSFEPTEVIDEERGIQINEVKLIESESGAEQLSLLNVRTAVWLDDQNIILLERNGSSDLGLQIVNYNIENNEKIELMSAETIMNALPSSEQDQDWQPQSIFASNPDDDTFLLMMAKGVPNESERFYFVGKVDYSGEQAVLNLYPIISEADNDAFVQTGANGWVTFSRFDTAGYEFYLENPILNESRFFESTIAPNNNWSPDGHWIAYGRNQTTIALYEPDSGFMQLIPHDYGFCDSLGWIVQEN